MIVHLLNNILWLFDCVSDIICFSSSIYFSCFFIVLSLLLCVFVCSFLLLILNTFIIILFCWARFQYTRHSRRLPDYCLYIPCFPLFFIPSIRAYVRASSQVFSVRGVRTLLFAYGLAFNSLHLPWNKSIYLSLKIFQCNESSFSFNRQFSVLSLSRSRQFCSSKWLSYSFTLPSLAAFAARPFFFFCILRRPITCSHWLYSTSFCIEKKKIQVQSNCVRFTFPRYHFVCHYFAIIFLICLKYV